METVIRKLKKHNKNLLIVGALDPKLLESMTIVTGTQRDSIDGEEGKATDLLEQTVKEILNLNTQ